jgi:hypothetical protein
MVRDLPRGEESGIYQSIRVESFGGDRGKRAGFVVPYFEGEPWGVGQLSLACSRAYFLYAPGWQWQTAVRSISRARPHVDSRDGGVGFVVVGGR